MQAHKSVSNLSLVPPLSKLKKKLIFERKHFLKREKNSNVEKISKKIWKPITIHLNYTCLLLTRNKLFQS